MIDSSKENKKGYEEETKMNKKRKKAAALALALGMTVSGNMAANAAPGDVNDSAATDVVSISSASGEKSSVLTGTIKVTNIRVQVPTAAAFEINPNAETTPTAVNQIEAQSTAYTITNLSTVPLDVTITGAAVALGNGTTGTTPKFVSKVADLSGDRAVMFAIRDVKEGAVPVEADAGKWLSSTFPYYVNGTTTASMVAAADPASKADELEMKLYGATKTGWTNNQTFTVTPVFTIAVHS